KHASRDANDMPAVYSLPPCSGVPGRTYVASRVRVRRPSGAHRPRPSFPEREPAATVRASPANGDAMSSPEPPAFYKTTPIFDEQTLPDKLRNAHQTKAGTWGIIRVLEGQLRYVIEETQAESILTPEQPGLVLPEQLHHVEPLG